MPKLYVEKYREFKSTAVEINSTQDVITRIDFEGPMLQLKYRANINQKEKPQWRIYDEFKPKPQAKPEGLTSTSAGPLPTLINKTQQSCKIMIKNVKIDKSENEVLDDLAKFFGEDCRGKIADIEPSKRSKHIYIMTCKDHSTAKKMALKYNKKELYNNKITLTVLNFE